MNKCRRCGLCVSNPYGDKSLCADCYICDLEAKLNKRRRTKTGISKKKKSMARLEAMLQGD